MAATTQKKYAPIVQAIIDGAHDENLGMIVQAAEWRKKKIASESGVRKGAKVLVADNPKRAGEFAGREGWVVRVHKVRTTVAFACEKCGRHEDSDAGERTAAGNGAEFVKPECGACWGVAPQAGIPTDLLTAVRT